MHAPLFHPALKAVGGVRRQLGMKSFFNILGPLVNPAMPNYQSSGVFNLETGRIYSYLLQREEKEFRVVHSLDGYDEYLLQREEKEFRVVHSLDGYDEVSLTAHTRIFSPKGEYLLKAADFSMQALMPHELYGGESVEDAAAIFLKVLQGEATKAQKNAVVANAALAIHCYRKSIDLQDAVEEATESLASKKALQKLHELIKLQ